MAGNMEVFTAGYNKAKDAGHLVKTVSKSAGSAVLTAASHKTESVDGDKPAFSLDITNAEQPEKEVSGSSEKSDWLAMLQPDKDKPAFALDALNNKSAGQDNSVDYELKKELFKGLVKRAYLLFPHQYTERSWKNFVRLMKDAVNAAGSGDDVQALNKAIRLLQQAFNGLRSSGLDPQYKNLQRWRPTEKIKTAAEQAMETMKNQLTEQSPAGEVNAPQAEAVGQAAEVAASPDVNVADAAPPSGVDVYV